MCHAIIFYFNEFYISCVSSYDTKHVQRSALKETHIKSCKNGLLFLNATSLCIAYSPGSGDLAETFFPSVKNNSTTDAGVF